MASMASLPARTKSREPVALHAHAMDNLRFIRETMESAGSFTAIPGRGGILMGLSALTVAVVAAWQPDLARWLAVWLGEAAVAVLIGAVTATKRHAQHARRCFRGRGASLRWVWRHPSLWQRC